MLEGLHCNCSNLRLYSLLSMLVNFFGEFFSKFFTLILLIQYHIHMMRNYFFTGCDQQNRYPMFLVRMGLGDIFLTRREVRFKRPPCKVCTTNVCLNHQELHDSVMANGGVFSNREFVVYDRNQSYPEYLIWYTV